MSRTNGEPPQPERWLDASVRDVSSFVDRRDFVKASGLAALLGAAGASQASAQEADDEYYQKTRPTVFTEQERQNAFENIETYDWAASQRDSAVAAADAIVDAWDKEGLWRLVPSQNIPRSYILTPWVSYVTTTDWSYPLIDDVGSVYATGPEFDWEITNTVEIDGEEREITIPTNDFAAYRESGRDDEGKFQPELADDSLLVNTKHPELGEDWGVDDGTGFIDTEGYLRDDDAVTWWNPVAWLNHWGAVYGMRRLCIALSDAYLYTENPEYAEYAAVILDRIGDVYDELSLNQMREDFTHVGDTVDGHGWAGWYNSSGTGRGKFVGAIWEAYQIREQLRNYDKIFPGLDEAGSAVDFLAGKQSEYPGLASKDTVSDVRKNVETGFVHEMLPAVNHAQVRGNFGFHQQTLAVAAVCADDPDGMTGEAIEYLFRPGTLLHSSDSPTGEWHATGGNVLGFLVGSPQSGYIVDEEGYPSESAPHYNTSQQNSLRDTANELRGYDGYEGADLFRNPKFKAAIDSHWQLTFGQYIPQIANTHGCGNPKAVGGASHRTIQSPDLALDGFDEYGKPELAQWAYMLNGMSTDGLERGIHHPNPVEIKDEIQSVIDEHGPFPDLESNQQPAYGFSALRDGDASSPRGVYQYYGRNYWNYSEGTGVGSAHIHYDTHNLGVYGYDLDLSPELGRQGNDWEDNNLGSWVESTPAHNTVTVDEENINSPQWVGYPRHFDHTERVQLMDIESLHAYEQTDEYRRTTAMVNVDEDTSYVADFFRVDGGVDHHFSFHAMTSFDVATEGLDLEAQDGGTYAGEDVGFGDGGHFSYLYDVERDESPSGAFSVDWDVEDYWDVRDDDGEPVHLRLTMLNDDIDEVALATGRPAEQTTENNPRELPFVLAHRGADRPEVPDPEVTYGDLVELQEANEDRTSRTSAYQGIRVEAKNDLEGFRVQLDPVSSGIQHATIRDADDNILADRDVAGVESGEYVDIPYDGIEAGTTYLITFGNYGDLYTRASSAEDFPVESDDFVVDAGIYYQDSATSSYRYNTTEVQAITSYEEAEAPEADPISSTFTSVIEPYEGERVVESSDLVQVEGIDEDADVDAVRAVEVDLANGRTDYVISSTDTTSKFEIDGRLEFKGAFAVYAERDGEKVFSYTNDALLITPDGEGSDVPLDERSLPRIGGVVEDFTKELSLENELEVEITDNPNGRSLSRLVGDYIYVEPADPDPIAEGVQEDRRYSNEARDRRNGVFRIEGVERLDPDRAVVDVGEHTFIRRYNTNDPADGYSYSIEEGAEFVVPRGKLSE